jgi:hypothetical protein
MDTEKNKRTRSNGEGTIFKHRNRWVAACYDIHDIRRTQSFKKKIEAETWLVEQVNLRKRFKGSYVVNPKQTVEEYLAEWLYSRRHQIRPNSYRHYETTIKNLIVPNIGRIPASRLMPATVKDLLNTLADSGYGHGSIIGVIRTLSKAYNDGRDDFKQVHNPIEGVKMISIEPKISKAVPAQDLTALYMVAKESPYDLARLMIGAELGLRPSEEQEISCGIRFFDFRHGEFAICPFWEKPLWIVVVRVELATQAIWIISKVNQDEIIVMQTHMRKSPTRAIQSDLLIGSTPFFNNGVKAHKTNTWNG